MELARIKNKLLFLLRHRRAPLFWLLAIVVLAVPWMWFRPIPAPSNEILTGHESYSGPICSVVRVVDGDTVKLDCGNSGGYHGLVTVRLYCIDAPEMGQEPWGENAKRVLRAITPSEIRLVVHGRDRYGRELGELVTTDEARENLNLSMVWSGEAVTYHEYCNDRRYYQAEVEAKKLPSGIWGTPGDHQRPWEWRHRH